MVVKNSSFSVCCILWCESFFILYCFLLSTVYLKVLSCKGFFHTWNRCEKHFFWPSAFEWELKFDTHFHFDNSTPCLSLSNTKCSFLLFVDSREESKNRFRYFYGAIILQKWLKTKHFQLHKDSFFFLPAKSPQTTRSKGLLIQSVNGRRMLVKLQLLLSSDIKV